MSDKFKFKFDNFVIGVREVNATALEEARGWANAIMNAEFRGRGDREKSVIARVSSSTGVSESYLKRLKYRHESMKDVAGSVYRALKIAYEDLCQRNEDAADRMQAERLLMRENNETADEKPVQARDGSTEAMVRKDEEA